MHPDEFVRIHEDIDAFTTNISGCARPRQRATVVEVDADPAVWAARPLKVDWLG